MKRDKSTLEQLNKKYKYQTDKERFDTSLDIWELSKDEGIIRADCESYCRYLKNNITDFKDWNYYYCKLNGNGHCVLYKNGDIIDCNIKSITTFEQYCKIYKVTEFKKYNWFTIFSKLLFAKIFKIIGRIND